jgi:omega-hydroxy-beta-dihydromenaquinone-9 sulfotransferase
MPLLVKAMRTKAVDGGAATSAASADYNIYRCYAFRIWYGMVLSAWLALLARNRFAVSPTRMAFVLFGFITSIVNSSLNFVQTLIFGRRIRTCVLEQPPIFIIGHWRTGTTFLHELLALDERFTAPTTLECFAPAQCLAFGWLLRKFSFFLPTNRPMDNMLVGWDHPQEDEFALMNLGLGSPYEAVVFPNHRRACHPFLTLTGLAPEQIDAWKAGFQAFLQQVNLRSKKEQKCLDGARRIVLKSPTHTARLHILRQMFPDAKFLHIVRDPCEVFSSTVRLWRTLFDTQGCQQPEFGALADDTPDIKQYVFDSMDLLYRDFFAEVAKIPVENFCHVRYEDLVRAPVGEIGRIYRELQLGSFKEIRPKLEARVRELDGYKPNQHRISDHRTEVCERWGWYMDRFGYRAPFPAHTAERTQSRRIARQLIPA